MKLVERSQRGAAEERDRLRRAAGGAPRREPDEAALRRLTDEISAMIGRLGIGALVPRDGGPEIEIIVDPEVTSNAETYVRALAGETDAGPEIHAALDRLAGRLETWHSLQGVLAAALQLDADLGDTDRWAGREEQAVQAELGRVLDGLSDGSAADLAPGVRDRLMARASGVRAERGAALEERQRERELTLTAQADADDTLAEGEAEAHMRRVARDLHEDRPVEDDELDDALATFAALTGGRTAGAPGPAEPGGRRGTRR